MKKKFFLIILIGLGLLNLVWIFIILNGRDKFFDIFSLAQIFFIVGVMTLGILVFFLKKRKTTWEQLIYSISLSLLTTVLVLLIKKLSILRAAQITHQNPFNYLTKYPFNFLLYIINFFVIYYFSFIGESLITRKINNGFDFRYFLKPSRKKMISFLFSCLIFPIIIFFIKNEVPLLSFVAAAYFHMVSLIPSFFVDFFRLFIDPVSSIVDDESRDGLYLLVSGVGGFAFHLIFSYVFICWLRYRNRIKE